MPAFGINKAGKIQEVKKVRSTDILTPQTSEEYRSVYESQTRHSDNEEGGDAQ